MANENKLHNPPNKMKVIKAKTKEEIDECLSIRRSVFILEQGVDEDLDIDGYDDASKHFLLSYNDVFCATARVRDDGVETKLERICVLKDYRKKGLGETLLRHILNYCHHNSKNDIITISAQYDSIPFYEKLGFEEFGGPYMDTGIQHISMCRPNY